MNQEYNASAIKVLKGLEAVRKRPGMYIGNTDELSGLHHMIYEVVDNAIDEALAGHCKNIKVALYPDGSASVEDDGRGMPIDMHPEEGVPAAEVIMTQLHAGGKFSQDSYKVSGGLHGVGVSVVCALSSWLELTVWRDKNEYTMSFKEGKTVEQLQKGEKTNKRGTLVRFLPDPGVFSKTTFDYDELCVRFRELAFLNPGARIVFTDHRDTSAIVSEFYDKGGVLSFARFLARGSDIIHETPVTFSGTRSDIEIDFALFWTKSEDENSLFFTNTIPQRDGGTHVIGFRTGLTRAFQNYVKERGSKAYQKIEFAGEDVREGMVCILSVKMADPNFSSQTKEKLVSSNVRQIVDSVITKVVGDFLEQNPSEAAIIMQKIVEAYNAKEAAKRARALSKKKKGNDIVWQVSQKLAACIEKNPEKCELFIVEGESAGGSAKQARNRTNQAVLPLRGKILNIEKANLHKMLNSEVISTLVGAIGTGIGSEFDISRLRYKRIIFMTDADVDGKHIQALLIVFFYRNLRKLIEDGHIYIATPPLYGVTEKHGIVYLADDRELIKYLMNRGLKNIELKDQNSNSVLEHGAFMTFMLAIHNLKEPLVSYSEIFQHAIAAKFFIEENYGNLEILRSYLSRTQGVEWGIEGSELTRVENGVKVRHSFNPEIINKKDKLNFISFTKSWSRYWDNNIFFDEKYVYDPFQLLKDITNKGREGIIVERFKGLGEMTAEQLRYAVMGNKDQRGEDKQRYIRLILNKNYDMDQLCATLMGDDVQPRREFIMENAARAQFD